MDELEVTDGGRGADPDVSPSPFEAGEQVGASSSSSSSTRHAAHTATRQQPQQLLSQSLLSPRIRIEEARQFNDELVEQDPGEQCDTLRDLGEIVGETLDTLAKQTNSENDHIIRDLDVAISDLHQWRELRQRQLEAELKDIEATAPGMYNTQLEDTADLGLTGDCKDERPETTEEEEGEEKEGAALRASNRTMGRHADQDRINSLTHLIESSRAAHSQQHTMVDDSPDHKASSSSSSSSYADSKGEKGQQSGVFPLRFDRNVSDIIEEQDRRIFSARLEQEIMESDVEREMEYLQQQLSDTATALDDDLDALLSKMGASSKS